ncbi:PAS domain S-box protein [Geofilum sp. OHC36d9]|uniref:PAS domain S-box protein n=1 Tax=Geofilum sp. OHC36d9 TaxID=3458413 RepID=UPI0040337B5C
MIALYIFISEKKSNIYHLETTEINKLDLQVNEIVTNFTFVERDVLLLRDMIASVETYACEEGITLEILKNDFVQYIYHKGLYDQIRFLDKNGDEKLRINYNSGNPQIVADSLLQNKSNRYYFEEMRSLQKDELYFSKFDLNIENGRLEYPYKPVMRIGTRVFNCNEEFCGVVLTNFLGEDLINRVKALNANSISRIHILEPKGYFLVSPNPEDNWGFMFEDRKDKTYANIYPTAWVKIKKENRGQFTTPAGLFTFKTLTFHQLTSNAGQENLKYYSSDEYWKIVSFISQEKINATHREILMRFYLPIGLLILLSIILSYFITKTRIKTRQIKNTIIDKNNFLFNVINSISESFYVVDINNNNVTLANKKANHYNIIEGSNFNENTLFTKPEIKSKLAELRNKIISSNEDQEIELKTNSGDQQSNYLEIRGYPIFDEHLKVKQLIEVIKDVTEEKLLDQKFKDLLASAADGMIITNTKGEIEMINNQAEKMFLYKAHELIGQKIEVLIPQKYKNHDKLRTNYAQRPTVREMGEGKELSGLKKNNEEFPIKVSLNPIITTAGTLISSSIRDISEEKLAERKIKENEQKFKALFDNQSQFIGLLQPDGTIIEMNETTLAFAGCSLNDLKQKKFWESSWWYTDEIKNVIKGAIKTASSGKFVRLEVDAIGVEKKIITMDFSFKPVKDDKEKIIFLIPEGRDITDKKNFEKALRGRERRWHLFVKQTPNAVAMLDNEMRYLAASDQWYTDYNIFGKELIGKSHYEIFPEIEKNKPEWIEFFKRCLQGETLKRAEEKFERQDGSVNWIRWEMSPWHSEMNQVGGIIIYTEEISERKKIENEIIKLNEGLEEKVQERTLELEKANKTILASKIEAERAYKIKSEFLANMSHEIRTPMNSVIGFSEILSKKVIDPVLKEFVNAIKSSGKTLLGIINDILDLSKMEAGKLEIQTEPVNIEELAKDIKALFEIKAKEKNLDLFINISHNMPHFIVIDELRIKQILINLINNAIKFTNEGFVKLTLNAQSVYNNDIDLEISVEDSGVGIKDEDQSKIFEAFHQKEGQITKKYGGTGLGLAISYKIVHLLKSNLQVKSKLNEGSKFYFLLKKVPIFKGELPTMNNLNFDLEEIQFNEAKILVIDDVEKNRMLIRNFLMNCNVQIYEAEDGLAGVQKCEEINPDLILMDIKMPVMDGSMALMEIRQIPQFKNTPIIAVTASVHLDNEIYESKYKFDNILYKPINLNELFLILTQYLPYNKTKKQNQIKSDTVSIDDLKINEEVKIALKNDFKDIIELLNKRQSNSATNQLKDKLLAFGDSHDIESFSKMGEKLSIAIKSFNINAVQELTNTFILFYNKEINA